MLEDSLRREINLITDPYTFQKKSEYIQNFDQASKLAIFILNNRLVQEIEENFSPERSILFLNLQAKVYSLIMDYSKEISSLIFPENPAEKDTKSMILKLNKKVDILTTEIHEIKQKIIQEPVVPVSVSESTEEIKSALN